MIKENFDFIFNTFLIQFLFNNILWLNIITNLIIYIFKNLLVSMLSYIISIINIGYNKHKFNIIENDIQILKTDVADLKTDVADLKTDVADLKNDFKDFKKILLDINNKLSNNPIKIAELTR